MSKASKMIQTMDQLQITQKPYKAHYLAEYDQKIRQQYLQLLFSVVSLEGFNDAQQRIWQLLSQSIGVDGASSDEMNSELIQNVVQSCVTNKLQHVFILDLLVLLRLNTVSEEQARILAELISLFSLTEKDAETLIHLSDLILNLSDKGQNLSEFKYETIRHWHEFSYQILTKELLITGLNGGRWIQLNDITEVNKPIDICNSSLHCVGEKVISVVASSIKILDSQFDVNLKSDECEINILKTNFSNQSIYLSSFDEEVLFEDCNFSRIFEADYDNPAYLNCPNGDLKINRCHFQMENIATINFTGNKLTVENSTFEKCGNPKGFGVLNVLEAELIIKNSSFINNFNKAKGDISAVRREVRTTNSKAPWIIEACNFIGNKNSRRNSLVLYFYYHNGEHQLSYNGKSHHLSSIIKDCSFINADISFKLYSYYNLRSTIHSSRFEKSAVYYLNSDRVEFDDCIFENGGKPNVIEISKEA